MKNVDLVWVEEESSGRVRLRCLGMCKEALSNRSLQLLGFLDQDPHPRFCKIINDSGRHDAESCGISDKAAEELIRRTGRAQVYRCNFGLTDIAVPVMVKGRHIATLFTGQVLREPPTSNEFVQIQQDVAHLNYIDVNQLEQAYRQVPVVPAAEIQNTVEILEAFAEFLGNSWLRLAESTRERRRKDRELQLYRKEFAYLVLESRDCLQARADSNEIRDLIRRIGFTRPPNRVLVAGLQRADENQEHGLRFDLQLAAALQTIEEVAERLDNVAAAHIRGAGICVFFHDPKNNHGSSNQLHSERLANRIVRAVMDFCELRVRVGLGTRKDDWEDLAESYREAVAALAGSDAVVATYRKPQGSFLGLVRNVEEMCRLLAERKLKEARAAAVSLPALVSRRLGSKAHDLAAAGLFFSSAIESMCATARNLGCDRGAIAALCDAATDEVTRVDTVLEMHESWLHFADKILEEVHWLYSGKQRKIVARACRMIEHNLELGANADELSMPGIAARLGVSASHMSRTFKREMGQTFERYVMEKRVELAKRMLLDPLNNVSQVARRCGFLDPSYFARVFRKIAGCSPKLYCSDPLRYGLPGGHPEHVSRSAALQGASGEVGLHPTGGPRTAEGFRSRVSGWGRGPADEPQTA